MASASRPPTAALLPPLPGPGLRVMLGLLLGAAVVHGITLRHLPSQAPAEPPMRAWATRSLSELPAVASTRSLPSPSTVATHPTSGAGALPRATTAHAGRHPKPPQPAPAAPDRQSAADPSQPPAHDDAAQAPSPSSAPAANGAAQAVMPAHPLAEPPIQTAASAPEPAASSPSTATAPPGGTMVAMVNPTGKPPSPAGGDARIRIPPPHGLDYDIQGEARGLGYSASGSLRWRHDGAAYDARLEIKAFLIGSRIQTSVGQITPAGLSPTRFGDKARSEQAAHFVRADGKVVFSANTPPAELGAGAQDRLSVLVQLAALVGADPEHYPAGKRLSLQTVSARESEIWDFVVGERKALTLPGGTLDAIRLTRQPRRPFDQTIDVWLAPALDYLPARVRITQPNGDWAEQSWRQTLPP